MTIKRWPPQYAAAVLIILYTVGTLGFIFPVVPNFAHLTPVNLTLSLILILWYEDNKGVAFWRWCLAAGIIGFAIEAIGVATGAIFGVYNYGTVLGYKIFETPLSIAVNWLLLAYASAVTVAFIVPEKLNYSVKAVFGATVMVALDVLIEPIAVKTGMWTWENGHIPFQNFVGWFVVALVIQGLFFRFNTPTKNKVAVVLLILQYAFFAILNLKLD